MSATTRLDLPVLLPDLPDHRDACVSRLISMVARQPGVIRAHVVGAAEPLLCLHYDSDRLTLAEIEALARNAGAAISGQFAHALLPIRAVTTEDDGMRLESTLMDTPGVTAASVSIVAQVARVEFDQRQITLPQVEAVLRQASAVAESAPQPPPTVHANVRSTSADSRSWYARHRELAWSVTSGALLLAGWLVERSPSGRPSVAIGLFVLSYVFGARDNVGHFLRDLQRGKVHFNIDLLMVVAAVGAAALGEWAEGALLLFLFSLGHALEHYALGRARHAITALADLAPSRATLLREVDGSRREELVLIEAVRPGDIVVVKPAERVPVDGTIREGRSGVNQAPITGESVPVDKVPGDRVFAGTVNGEGALVIEVSVAVGDRTLDRVIKLVSEAQTQKAPTQQFTERFARVFVPVVLIGDLLLIVAPPLLGVLSWPDAFARAMAVLVAASPCALALGTPAAVLAGIAQAARNGVLIKGGAHLEALGAIRSLALDKTGTLTVGEPSVTDIVPMEGVSERMLLGSAAAVEQRSQHPLARAVVGAASQRDVPVSEAGELQSVIGRGVRAPVEGAVVEVGRALLFVEAGVMVPLEIGEAVARLERAGRSTMIVRRIGHVPEFLGVLGLADEPRHNAKATVHALRAAGFTRIVMLTGDNAGVANAVGDAVGVDDVRAGLLPADKVDAIKELAADGPVAMVGDGVNDAPALAHATVGIAMGGAGTAAALETADVALMGDDLGRLPFAVELSRQARRIIRQNLWVSLGVIVVLVVATVSGVASIGPAVIAHEGSTLVVIANALRLLRFQDREGRRA
jgi:Cd2+/Zn2+-exporting ATPase